MNACRRSGTAIVLLTVAVGALTGALAGCGSASIGARASQAHAYPDSSLATRVVLPDVHATGGRIRPVGASDPMVLGHRGGTERAYQNTLAAFDDAIALHLDYIETDVRHTADGVAVLMHDPQLPHVCTRYPGVAVRALTAAQVADVRCAGQPVPRLSQLVARLRLPDALHVGLMAEVKDVDPLGVRDLLAPLGWNRVIIESFIWPALATIEAASPQVVTCPLGVTAATLATALTVTHDCIGPSQADTSPDLVGRAHLAGVGLLVWTVDDPVAIRALADEGVDGIITDHPRVALRLLRGPTPNARTRHGLRMR